MLTPTELDRYNRQIMMAGFGEAGQEKLKKARVFIAGAGGLGSPISIYLANAGIGAMRIVDQDKVELSNLNRQILHWPEDVGRLKVDSARDKLQKMNPDLKLEAIRETMNEKNLSQLTEGCDVIVDAMDNMAGRRVLNIASVRKGIPYIYGGVHQLDGMATTFLPGKTPCLECVFPDSGPLAMPAVSSILGSVPGVIASIQCIEAVKIILGFPGLLAGRLLCFCGTDMSFREFKVNRDPECPICRQGLRS